MNDEAAFLDVIKANPENRFLRLVYADWLEERGDVRSNYLRVDCQLHELIASAAPEASASDIRRLRAQLKKLGKTLDADWLALFAALRPKVFRCRACRKVISAKEAIDTKPRSYRKMKTSRYCKLCYEDAVRSQLQRGMHSGSSRSAERDYHGGPGDDD